MTKVYGIPSCPDCAETAKKIGANDRESEFEIASIGEHVAHLKMFLQPRNREEAFQPIREGGYAGAPCFIREDGTVSFNPAEFSL